MSISSAQEDWVLELFGTNSRSCRLWPGCNSPKAFGG